jgi:hypothetical protein
MTLRCGKSAGGMTKNECAYVSFKARSYLFLLDGFSYYDAWRWKRAKQRAMLPRPTVDGHMSTYGLGDDSIDFYTSSYNSAAPGANMVVITLGTFEGTHGFYVCESKI